MHAAVRWEQGSSRTGQQPHHDDAHALRCVGVPHHLHSAALLSSSSGSSRGAAATAAATPNTSTSTPSLLSHQSAGRRWEAVQRLPTPDWRESKYEQQQQQQQHQKFRNEQQQQQQAETPSSCEDEEDEEDDAGSDEGMLLGPNAEGPAYRQQRQHHHHHPQQTNNPQHHHLEGAEGGDHNAYDDPRLRRLPQPQHREGLGEGGVGGAPSCASTPPHPGGASPPPRQRVAGGGGGGGGSEASPGGRHASVGGATACSSMGRERQLAIDLTHSRHPVVRRAAAAAGLSVLRMPKRGAGVDEPPDIPAADIVWLETSVSIEKVLRVAQAFMQVNHFAGMDMIGRKVPLVQNTQRLARFLPEEYGNVMPIAFTEFSDFSKYRQTQVQVTKKVRKAYYIVKPNGGCMGKGIYLTSNPSSECFEGAVVQEYLANPLLIDGRKFDLRCYVLVLSVTPPRIFFYEDGLLRLCSEPYQAVDDTNFKTKCMHLSNYSVNKRHSDFEVGTGDTGGKRNFAFLTRWLDERGHDSSAFWARTHDLVVKTVLSIAPSLASTYDTASSPARSDDGFSCFELLGFDILVDSSLNPLLCEVNHSPSLVTDTPFDAAIKQAMLTEAFELISIARKSTRLRPLINRDSVAAARKAGGDQEALSVLLGLKKVKRKSLRRRESAEDAALKVFSRVYPSPDAESHARYRRILQTGVATQGMAGKRPPSARSTPKPAGVGKPRAAASAGVFGGAPKARHAPAGGGVAAAAAAAHPAKGVVAPSSSSYAKADPAPQKRGGAGGAARAAKAQQLQHPSDPAAAKSPLADRARRSRNRSATGEGVRSALLGSGGSSEDPGGHHGVGRRGGSGSVAPASPPRHAPLARHAKRGGAAGWTGQQGVAPSEQQQQQHMFRSKSAGVAAVPADGGGLRFGKPAPQAGPPSPPVQPYAFAAEEGQRGGGGGGGGVQGHFPAGAAARRYTGRSNSNSRGVENGGSAAQQRVVRERLALGGTAAVAQSAPPPPPPVVAGGAGVVVASRPERSNIRVLTSLAAAAKVYQQAQVVRPKRGSGGAM